MAECLCSVESGRSSESGRPVTAMQRQREREEKRRRKMEKAKEKRKQKKNNKGAICGFFPLLRNSRLTI